MIVNIANMEAITVIQIPNVLKYSVKDMDLNPLLETLFIVKQE
jgi:hypothetical protein